MYSLYFQPNKSDAVTTDWIDSIFYFLKYYEDSDCTFIVIPINGGIDAVFILGDATDVMTKIPDASYEDVNVCISTRELYIL